MTLDQILTAVDELSLEDRHRLQSYLAGSDTPRPSRTAEEWMTELERIARDFRGDSTDEEMAEIFAAMSLKTPSVDKEI